MLPNLTELKKAIEETLFQLRVPMYRRQALRNIALAVGFLITSATLTVIGTQTFVAVYQVAMERLQFPMIRAEIESMRTDAEATPCDQAVMMRATVAAINQRIEHEHESNRHWYSDWASTDRWQAVQPIRFHCEEREHYVR